MVVNDYSLNKHEDKEHSSSISMGTSEENKMIERPAPIVMKSTLFATTTACLLESMGQLEDHFDVLPQ